MLAFKVGLEQGEKDVEGQATHVHEGLVRSDTKRCVEDRAV